MGIGAGILASTAASTLTPHSLFGNIGIWGLLLVGGFLIWKTGLAKVWKDNAEALKTRSEEAERRLEELLHDHQRTLHLVGEQKKVIERLEALPNLEKVINLMTTSLEKQKERGDEMLKMALEVANNLAAQHESRASERHAELVLALKAQVPKGA